MSKYTMTFANGQTLQFDHPNDLPPEIREVYGSQIETLVLQQAEAERRAAAFKAEQDALKAKQDQYLRESREREAQAERDRQQAEREAGQQELARYKQTMRESWLANGGSAASFEQAWPQISRDRVRALAENGLSRDDRRKEAIRKGFLGELSPDELRVELARIG